MGFNDSETVTTAVMGHLISRIYEAALDASRWQRDVLPTLARAMHSELTMVWAHDFSGGNALDGADGLAGYHGVDASAIDSFMRYYSSRNVWLQDERLHREGRVVVDDDLYPTRDLGRTEWFGDWLRPLDLFYTCAAIVEKRHDRSFNVTAVRGRARGPYTPEERRHLALLMPHFQSAFALHRRLRRSELLAHASLQVLEALPMGVLLLDSAGDVLHASALALGLLRDSGALSVGPGERLQGASSEADARLRRAIKAAVDSGRGHGWGTPGGTGLRLRGPQGQELHVLVLPLPLEASPLGLQTAGVVFVSNPAQPLRSLEGALRALYGLTAAEARLAQGIVNGLTPAEYALQQGVAVSTVRTQFKAAAAKVGVSRQADFVRVLLTGSAMLGSAMRGVGPSP